ncbi:hypothetical protein BB8028_0004g10320 [Beauveria bassiana]|uniref:Uncharacterized protein n=1 Tax=Beauveria bassiana TaxID=176275 RepID=A0A2S7YE05_BEABA|nr:hypothetical protein BB8028_0004g10320 [Beauveria bassiana]
MKRVVGKQSLANRCCHVLSKSRGGGGAFENKYKRPIVLLRPFVFFFFLSYLVFNIKSSFYPSLTYLSLVSILSTIPPSLTIHYSTQSPCLYITRPPATPCPSMSPARATNTLLTASTPSRRPSATTRPRPSPACPPSPTPASPAPPPPVSSLAAPSPPALAPSLTASAPPAASTFKTTCRTASPTPLTPSRSTAAWSSRRKPLANSTPSIASSLICRDRRRLVWLALASVFKRACGMRARFAATSSGRKRKSPRSTPKPRACTQKSMPRPVPDFPPPNARRRNFHFFDDFVLRRFGLFSF